MFFGEDAGQSRDKRRFFVWNGTSSTVDVDVAHVFRLLWVLRTSSMRISKDAVPSILIPLRFLVLACLFETAEASAAA